jgi:hypothetical protein
MTAFQTLAHSFGAGGGLARLLGFGLALLLTTPHSSARTTALRVQSGSVISPPPSSLMGPPRHRTFYRSPDHTIVASAQWHLSDRLVSIRTLQHIAGAPDRTQHVKQALRYWPTCVAKISDLRLCVAGKSPRTGNTILELWHMKPPSLASDGVTLVPAAIESVKDVYDAAVAGREDVRAILPLWSPASNVESVLVWFEQSRAVWKVHLVTGEFTPIASPAPVAPSGGSGFHAPYLTEATRAWAGIEAGGGHVYVFDRRTNDVPLDASQPSLLVLRDAQRDGVIESATLETAAALIAAGWNQSQHWTAW